MNKKYIIKDSRIFDYIIQNGKSIYNNCYKIFYLPDDYLKFGFAIGKKNGNAVNRNLIKRQIKTIIRNNKFVFKNNYNYIIMVRKGYFDLDFKSKEQEFIKLIEKVN